MYLFTFKDEEKFRLDLEDIINDSIFFIKSKNSEQLTKEILRLQCLLSDTKLATHEDLVKLSIFTFSLKHIEEIKI